SSTKGDRAHAQFSNSGSITMDVALSAHPLAASLSSIADRDCMPVKPVLRAKNVVTVSENTGVSHLMADDEVRNPPHPDLIRAIQQLFEDQLHIEVGDENNQILPTCSGHHPRIPEAI